MLKEFVYLFLVDLSRVPFDHTYQSYSQDESGYGPAMLQAYVTAFSTPTHGEVSEDLMKKINKAAMQWSATSAQGQYRSSYNNFAIAPFEMKDEKNKSVEVPTYSVSNKGMEEFLNYWMGNNKSNCFLAFETSQPDAPGYLINYHSNGLIVRLDSPSGGKSVKLLDFKQGLALINQLLGRLDYTCEINPLAKLPEEEIHATVAQISQKLIRNFNNQIKNADTENKKITLIVTFVQRLTQLHPWMDGNIRTCYVLLNKLLRDHALSLSLLMNPNRLDCCSVAELVEMVKQGQIHFQQVKNHSEARLTLNAPSEKSAYLQHIICTGQELYDVSDSLITSFINTVVNGIEPKINGLANNPFRLLAEPKSVKDHAQLLKELSLIAHIDDKKYDSFMSAVKNKSYSLALRKACAGNNAILIQTLLKFAESLAINPKEQSSNGKNAYDWLAENTSLIVADKELIQEQLLVINLSKLTV